MWYFDRRIPGLACSLVWAALVGGCAQDMPQTDVGREVADVAGVGQLIRFLQAGGPIDVAASDTAALTAPDAIRLALSHDPGIQAAMARMAIARADATQSRLLPNPILSVVLRWPDGGGKPDIEAGLTAELVSLLTRSRRTGAADGRLQAAAADVLTVTLDVLAEVQTRYVAVQTNYQLVAVLEDRVRVLDRLLGAARARVDAGEGVRLDTLGLEARRVELQTDLADRRLDVVEQRLSLARLMGSPSSTFAGTLSPWPTDERPLAGEVALIRAALNARPEVNQQRWMLVSLGEEARLAPFTAFDGTNVGINVERDGDWSVGPGISLPVPLFDFGQARRDRARAVVIEARHQMTRVGRQIVEETRRAYAAVLSSRDNLNRVRSELVPIAERSLQQAEAQFAGGQTDLAGLLLAEEQLRSARTRFVELSQRHAGALIRLERAVGGPTALAAVPTVPTTVPSVAALIPTNIDQAKE